jgi:hypothetical protein
VEASAPPEDWPAPELLAAPGPPLLLDPAPVDPAPLDPVPLDPVVLAPLLDVAPPPPLDPPLLGAAPLLDSPPSEPPPELPLPEHAGKTDDVARSETMRAATLVRMASLSFVPLAR